MASIINWRFQDVSVSNINTLAQYYYLNPLPILSYDYVVNFLFFSSHLSFKGGLVTR